MVAIPNFPDYYMIGHRVWSEKNKNGLFLKASPDRYGYLQVMFRLNGKSHMKRIHRLIAEIYHPDYEDSLFVDHINGDKTDNRLENIRMVTKGENNRAFRSPFQGGTSKGRGVHWCKRDNRWRAQISFDSKKIHIGNFLTEEEAIKAYNRKAIDLGFAKEALN